MKPTYRSDCWNSYFVKKIAIILAVLNYFPMKPESEIKKSPKKPTKQPDNNSQKRLKRVRNLQKL